MERAFADVITALPPTPLPPTSLPPTPLPNPPAALIAPAPFGADRPDPHLPASRQLSALRRQVEEALPEPRPIDLDALEPRRGSVWPDGSFLREGPASVDDWAGHVERLRRRPADETLPERMERLSHLGDLLRLHPEHVDEAIDCQEQALDLARKLGDQQARASVELRLAIALQYAGRHPAALRHYARADTIIRVTRLRMMRDRVEYHRGTCLAELGNRAGARAAFEEALKMRTRRKWPDALQVARTRAALEALDEWAGE